jgi:Coenzyme PQQ synthesis protein D (PqqD)
LRASFSGGGKARSSGRLDDPLSARSIVASFSPMPGPIIGPPHEHILEEEVADEVLLYDDENKLFVSLNPQASDIWRLASGEFSVEEIVLKIASSYDSEPDTIRSDVERTIDELVDKELIPPVT